MNIRNGARCPWPLERNLPAADGVVPLWLPITAFMSWPALPCNSPLLIHSEVPPLKFSASQSLGQIFTFLFAAFCPLVFWSLHCLYLMKHGHHCESPVEQQFYCTVLILASKHLALVSHKIYKNEDFFNLVGKLWQTEQRSVTEHQI